MMTKMSWPKGSQTPSASARGTHGFGSALPNRMGPRVGTSHQAPDRIPIPRVSVLHLPSSPSLDPLAYWLMEPSELTIFPRDHWELPCAIHGSGPCSYPVAVKSSVLSSLSSREGREEGEEGFAIAEGVDEVATVVEDNDESVKVIPLAKSPPRSVYKQRHRSGSA
jgi:hypothetical protein